MWTLEPQLRFESWFIFILAALPWVTYSLLYQCLARGQHHACVSMVGTAIEHLQCTNQGSQSVTCINSINPQHKPMKHYHHPHSEDQEIEAQKS